MYHSLSRSALPLLLACAAMPAAAQLETGEAPTKEQVATGEVPATPFDEAETVYRSFGGTMVAPAWSKPAAEDLLAYVDRSGEDGLDPADYAPDALRAALAGGEQAALDRAATDSFLRVSADLALGNVPMAARDDWHLKDNDLTGAQQFTLMRKAIQDGTVRDTLASLLPTHPQYAELKGVLATTSDKTTADKVRVNLDRWRWLPRDLGRRYVIVNVPAYTVALVEDGHVVARHKAVVGAPKTATPQLGATATGVILNPWWEVPKSITPEVQGKRGYVRVKAGEGWRYRQPPGPANALGRMKVVMPNNYAIYLHDTPSKSAFNKPARAFSHGCIRTQDPLAFAELLLGNPEWDRAAIDAAIASGKTVEAKATTPTPVYITYFTAAAAQTGKIVSYKDVYGRDGSVVVALNQRAGTALASAGE
ncbi:MAG TPA: L,D-transpeptidase family protein [Allosphingosinicella sp.]|jgi:murein L,D-transpeptidase YcbB/YkuD